MSKGNTWQHRVADTDEERFGLLDKPTMLRYRTQPVFQEPEGKRRKDKGLTAMSITGGIGSMLLGAQDIGFKVLGNVEWRDYYRYRSPITGHSSFTDNFPGAYQARGFLDVPSDLMPGSIDFAAGHPECGRYSALSHSVNSAAYKETRGADLSDLPLFLKLIAQVQPRFFLMDDLPGSLDPLPISEYIKLLPDYDLYPEWISNWGYGNIQKHRNRMFMIGAKKSERFVFQPGEAAHDLVLSDIIGDLLEVLPGEVPNHAMVDPDFKPGRYSNMQRFGDRPTWGELVELFDMDEWGKNAKYYSPEGEQKTRPGTTNPKWDGYCPVLSGGYNPIHPNRRTPLSIRERARIQGFPDSYIFHHDAQGPERLVWEPYNSDGQRGIKQTGKAMPIQFCTYVAKQVKAKIEGKKFKTTGERVAKPNLKVSEAKIQFCQISGYADQDSACKACWLRDTCPVYAANNVVEKTEEVQP